MTSMVSMTTTYAASMYAELRTRVSAVVWALLSPVSLALMVLVAGVVLEIGAWIGTAAMVLLTLVYDRCWKRGRARARARRGGRR